MVKALTSRLAPHIYFWFVLFLFFFLYRFGPNGVWSPDLRWALAIVATYVLAVYYHFYLFETFYSTRRYAWYISLLFLGVLAWTFFVLQVLPMSGNAHTQVIGFLVSIMLFIGVTTALKLLRNDMRHRLQLQEPS